MNRVIKEKAHGVSGGVVTFAATCIVPLELREYAEGKILFGQIPEAAYMYS